LPTEKSKVIVQARTQGAIEEIFIYETETNNLTASIVSLEESAISEKKAHRFSCRKTSADLPPDHEKLFALVVAENILLFLPTRCIKHFASDIVAKHTPGEGWRHLSRTPTTLLKKFTVAASKVNQEKLSIDHVISGTIALICRFIFGTWYLPDQGSLFCPSKTNEFLLCPELLLFPPEAALLSRALFGEPLTDLSLLATFHQSQCALMAREIYYQANEETISKTEAGTLLHGLDNRHSCPSAGFLLYRLAGFTWPLIERRIIASAKTRQSLDDIKCYTALLFDKSPQTAYEAALAPLEPCIRELPSDKQLAILKGLIEATKEVFEKEPATKDSKPLRAIAMATFLSRFESVRDLLLAMLTPFKDKAPHVDAIIARLDGMPLDGSHPLVAV